MNKDPLISVIITFYNEEKYLNRCMNSVLNQSYSNIEVVFVNDGSTDHSLEVAENTLPKFINSKIVSIQNIGPGGARNQGLKEAHGEYIVFLDADDELKPEMISELYKNLKFYDSDLSIGMHSMFDFKNELIQERKWADKNELDQLEAISLVIQNKIIRVSWGKLYKREFITNCHFPLISWKEDDVFLLSYLFQCKKVSICNKNLVSNHCKPNSLTRQTISNNMIADITWSYNEQSSLIASLNNKSLEKDLFCSQISTFVSLFLIIKIDWNFMSLYRDSILTSYLTDVFILTKKASKHKIGVKKLFLLYFLYSPKRVGWNMPLRLLAMLKKKHYKQLQMIKQC